MESEWLDLMPEFDAAGNDLKVTLEPFVSVGSYQDDAVYGDPIALRGRVEPMNVEMRDNAGQVRQIAAVWYPYNPPVRIGQRDRVTLPGDGDVAKRQPRIFGVTEQYDERGLHHYEVYLEQRSKP